MSGIDPHQASTRRGSLAVRGRPRLGASRFDEETAIAALLHDAVEDQGGLETAELIRTRFGDRVADLVLACTDSVSADPDAKGPWAERKAKHLAKLRSADAATALITAADKLHNLTATLRDVEAHGPETLQRFARPDRIVWYFSEVAAALEAHASRAPVAELSAQTGRLERLLAERT